MIRTRSNIFIFPNCNCAVNRSKSFLLSFSKYFHFQVSGFRLRYDLTRPRGDRLLMARVLGGNGLYRDLVDTETYSVIMTEFLAGGGDGYSVISDNKLRQLQGPLDTDIIKEYLKHVSPIQSELEGRIQILDINDNSSSGGNQGILCNSLALLVTTIVFSLHSHQTHSVSKP